MSVPGDAERPTRLGRYELITRIGQGGMAEVQLALQRGPAGFEKLVVVKLVHENLATQKPFVDMLLDEARVAALVKHPNVVDIYDLGQANGRYFIAMEYLEGEPLLAVLRAGRDGKRLDPLSTGRLIADTAEGLDAAHELRSMSGERIELVHHDISLGNIVVLYNGQVKLVDFGVAKANMTAGPKAKVQGKFSYMAPEKLKGAQGDRRSDIFSLACVMWEALTLRRLFRGGNDNETMRQVLEMAIQPPSKVNGDVPPEYDPIVMRALDRDPAKRHGSAKELAVEIEEVLRKRGYGAKNDKVARYMQDTFKDHIEARKKLVQEVVSKGTASVEVLDAAFNDPVLASGSPVTPVPGADFSMKYRRVTPASGVPVAAAFADSSKPTEISKPPIEFGGATTEVTVPPVLDDAVEREPSRPGVPAGGGASPLVAKLRALLADPKRRLIAAGAAGVLLLVIVLALVAGGGHKPDANRVAEATPGSDVVAAGSGSADVVAAAPVGSGSEHVAETGSGTAVAADQGSGSAVAPDRGSGSAVADEGSGKGSDLAEIQIDNGKGSSSSPPGGQSGTHHPEHPVAAVDADALFKQGQAEFMKGKPKDALEPLLKARAARPRFAPTYRMLGLVYKALGNHGEAKSNLQKYLSLAPNAPDAVTIQGLIKQL